MQSLLLTIKDFVDLLNELVAGGTLFAFLEDFIRTGVAPCGDF